LMRLDVRTEVERIKLILVQQQPYQYINLFRKRAMKVNIV